MNTLKQMIGDSTMVKNYPESYKGILKDVYTEAAQAGTLPLYYCLFMHFSSAGTLAEAKPDDIFYTGVLPYLHGAIMQDGKLVKMPNRYLYIVVYSKQPLLVIIMAFIQIILILWTFNH
nr:hypothetical protein [Providencia alcalifaciens]